MGDDEYTPSPNYFSTTFTNNGGARSSSSRPIHKLSVKLVDTYKRINTIYYEEKARKLSEQADITRGGVNNNGYDDQNYDYILAGDEIIFGRYILKHRIGKGSFGQVVCAYDKERQCEVAIKIIKSKRPFFIQAQTEIQLLNVVKSTDMNDESSIVRLLDHFVYRSHQCLVFEMLSYNLYELLKNTRFKGISLSLIRKFSRQILQALYFLSSSGIDIIHCDLKPENILLRHPQRSAIKIIDFGSSCVRTQRAYTYIQSRFYRSPEVLLGMTYDQKIDIWSLGCVLVEMHVGEPLFGGADQADQMSRIVDILGMPSATFLETVGSDKLQFFCRIDVAPNGSLVQTPDPNCDPTCVSWLPDSSAYYILKRATRADAPAPRTLADIIGVHTCGPQGRRRGDLGHSEERYLEFLHFIQSMMVYDPEERISAADALQHPYVQLLLQGAHASQEPQTPVSAVQAASASVTEWDHGFATSSSMSHQQQQQQQQPNIRSSDIAFDRNEYDYVTGTTSTQKQQQADNHSMTAAHAQQIQRKRSPSVERKVNASLQAHYQHQHKQQQDRIAHARGTNVGQTNDSETSSRQQHQYQQPVHDGSAPVRRRETHLLASANRPRVRSRSAPGTSVSASGMRLRSRERDGPHVSSAATMSSGDCGNGYNEGVVVTNTHQSQQTFARRKQYGGQLPLKEDSSMKNAHTVSQSGYYVSHESLHTMAPFDQNDSASGNTNSANVTPANEGHNDGLSDVQTGAQGWSKHMAMNMHLSSHSGTNAYMFKTSKH